MPRQRYQEPKLRQTKRGVWFVRPWVDVIVDGKVSRAKKTISLGVMGKRDAQAQAREVMRTINRADYVVTSQINFGKFLDEYEKLHVERLAASSQERYRCHIKNHIRPAFEKLMLCELTPMLVQEWLDSKPQSWATKTDLRNILSNVYNKAIEWGTWKDINPIDRFHAGRKKAVREHRKLTDDETRALLAALPGDVRLLCSVCLFGTLRISEALGLQEKHLDFNRGVIEIRQRLWRGNLDAPKNDAAKRDVPMGYLSQDLQKICVADPDHYLFEIWTNPKRGKPTRCKDDRHIQLHFLRPAAQALGCYWNGFGFHSFRREAITALGDVLSAGQLMRIAGHTNLGMTGLYTLSDRERQEKAVRGWQESILGSKVN